MSLIAELQRRSVFKVGAAYVVVAWIVVQAAGLALPAFDAPAWVLRVFILFAMLGFPLALVLAWAFELTPEGVKVDVPGVGSKRIFVVAAALAVASLAWFRYGSGDATSSADAGVDKRSIAVLPFVNMSGDKDNQYFSDGISEEILNSLAQMPGLKVAARTSSFSFRDDAMEVPEIARQLEVRMVLEGSVRKQGDRVRITAQLIDAQRGGFHLWSQTYDRELKDIFAIQDEIAHAIADELQVKLSAGHGEGADTKDLTAYDEYLKGMQLWQAREEANLREAEKLFRSALDRDPDFAKAWAGLALTKLVLPEWTNDPVGPSWAIARDAAEHAAALDPSLPEPGAVLGYIALTESRLATGRAVFARVHALAPSYATGWQWHGEGLFYAGDIEGSIAATRRASQLDPKSAVVRQAYANSLVTAGRDAEAIAICDAVLAEFPNWFTCLNFKYDVLLASKDYSAARALLRGVAEPRGPDAVRFADQMSDAVEGRGDIRKVAQRLAAMTDGTIDTNMPVLFTDYDALWIGVTVGLPVAMLPRARALQSRLPYTLRGSLYDVHLLGLHCLPEYAAIIREVGIDAATSAALCERSKQPRRAPPPPPPKKS